MRRVVRILLGVTAAALLLGAAYALLPAVGSVSPEALDHSVNRAVDADEMAMPCVRAPRGAWTCTVYDSGSSEEGRYRVVLRGKRCWDARRLPDGGRYTGFPATVSGCVKLRDQLRPLAR